MNECFDNNSTSSLFGIGEGRRIAAKAQAKADNAAADLSAQLAAKARADTAAAEAEAYAAQINAAKLKAEAGAIITESDLKVKNAQNSILGLNPVLFYGICAVVVGGIIFVVFKFIKK